MPKHGIAKPAKAASALPSWGNGRFKFVPWLPPVKGPNRPAIGFENYPVGLYTTKACEEPGMKVASYDGRWEKLPDFDALKPAKQGVIRHIDQEHFSGTTWRLEPPNQNGIRILRARFRGGGSHLTSIDQAHLSDALLPYWKSSKMEDGSDQWTAHPSGVKATGYLKVEKAGDYTFSLHSYENISQLVVGSEIVVHNDGQGKAAKEVKHGTVHLAPGVHPVTLTFLNARQRRDPQQLDQSANGLHVGFPKEFVRSLTAGDIASIRLQAGALLAEGNREEAKALLTKLHRGGWPLSEREQEHVEQARMRIRRMAKGLRQRPGACLGSDRVLAGHLADAASRSGVHGQRDRRLRQFGRPESGHTRRADARGRDE